MNLSREEGSMLELFSSNAQNSGAASVGPMAFKMSLESQQSHVMRNKSSGEEETACELL